MTRFFATLLFVLAAGFSALGQEDPGGPQTSEDKPHVLLQSKKEIETASHTEESSGMSVEDEDAKVLAGMDKPEPLAEELTDASEVHDLDDHQLVWAHEPSEHHDIALAQLQASDAGPLPNFTLSQGDGDDSSFDDSETAPEDRGETSDVFNDPDGSTTESEADLAKDDAAVNLVDYGDEPEGNETEISMMNIAPEKGDKVPAFAHSFPGCGCDFSEWQSKWSCSGTIATPKGVSGKECCCCTMSCDRRNRCDHETCDAIGIDQRAEVNAAEAARKKKLGDADALVCGDVKLYRISLGAGRCGNAKNIAACKKVGKTALCDHQSYARGQCYSPAKAKKQPCVGKHFSHGAHLRSMHLDIMDFYGHCFVTSNGDHTLIPNGESHAWNNHRGVWYLNDPGTVNKRVQAISSADMDSGNALGGWHTYCVDEKPN